MKKKPNAPSYDVDKVRKYIMEHHQDNTVAMMARALKLRAGAINKQCAFLGVEPISMNGISVKKIKPLAATMTRHEVAHALKMSYHNVVRVGKENGILFKGEDRLGHHREEPSELTREQERARHLRQLRAECKSEAEFRDRLEAQQRWAELSSGERDVPTDEEGNLLKKPRFKGKYDNQYSSDIVRKYWEGE